MAKNPVGVSQTYMFAFDFDFGFVRLRSQRILALDTRYLRLAPKVTLDYEVEGEGDAS